MCYAGYPTVALLLAGCASPGPPLPPSLKLPEVATDLTAMRVGGQVTLRWTTPTHTTDKLLIAGPVTAEICRSALPAAASPPRREGAAEPCAAVLRQRVTPGASDAVDTLPPELAAGPARLLAYRVQLKNAAGRTAGPSAAVFAAAGAAPQPVELRATDTKQGAVLQWRPGTGDGEGVELERTIIEAPPGATAQPMDALPGVGKEPKEEQFRAGAAGQEDPGGTIDRTAAIGATYQYIGQRVRSVAVGGQTLELRSVPSAAVTVEMRDVFPPEAPTGLVAVPELEFGGEGEAPRRSIDLSWNPNMEPRVAGYRVYRRDAEGGEWKRLGTDLVREAAFRDLTVAAGRAYAYRVTAVSDAGFESAPSAEVTETAPTPQRAPPPPGT